MPNHPQYGCDLARVRGHGHEGLVLTSLPSEEDLTKGFGAPPILRGTRLSCNTIPQFIFLGETVFNGPVREEGVDVGFAVSVVTGMDANPLAEEFFDEWFKWGAVFGEIQAVEGEIGCLEGSCQWADVVSVRRVDVLGGYSGLPEGMGDESLCRAGFCEGGVGPGCCAVAV